MFSTKNIFEMGDFCIIWRFSDHATCMANQLGVIMSSRQTLTCMSCISYRFLVVRFALLNHFHASIIPI